jgi:hypothetical protein
LITAYPRQQKSATLMKYHSIFLDYMEQR